MVSVASSLRTGLAVALVAGAAVAALPDRVGPAIPAPALSSPAVQLSALMAALPQPAAAAPTPPTTNPFVGSSSGSAGSAIINAYDAIEPWAQYGVELGAWAVGWLPWPIDLAAPQMNIAYNGIEPVVQASVYSLAYLIDGQPELIGPTLTAGVQTGFTNFVQGEISWFASFFPPLPPIPFPPFPGATTVTARAAAGSPRVAAATAAVTEAPIAPIAAVDPVTDPVTDAPPLAPAEPHVGRGPQRVEPAAPAAAAAADPAPAVTDIPGDDAAGPTNPARSVPTTTTRGHRGGAHVGTTRAASADDGANAGRQSAR
jgi:hypothetical protein